MFFATEMNIVAPQCSAKQLLTLYVLLLLVVPQLWLQRARIRGRRDSNAARAERVEQVRIGHRYKPGLRGDVAIERLLRLGRLLIVPGQDLLPVLGHRG